MSRFPSEAARSLSVQRLLDRLDEQGGIQHDPLKSRNIRLTGKGIPQRGLIVWGQIAAGPLAEAIVDKSELANVLTPLPLAILRIWVTRQQTQLKSNY